MGESESAPAAGNSAKNGTSPDRSLSRKEDSADALEEDRSSSIGSQSSESDSHSSSTNSNSTSGDDVTSPDRTSIGRSTSSPAAAAAAQPAARPPELSGRLSKSTHDLPACIEPQQPKLERPSSDPSPIAAAQESERRVTSEKYWPRTRSPSDGSDVRWYFCKTSLQPHEPAAKTPATEVVGRGEYFRFSKGDTDALEAAFLEREEELVRGWWREYAESREGPSTASSYQESSPQISEPASRAREDDFESSRRSHLTAWDDQGNVGVVVKGGLYEVDLASRRCMPVYWRGDHRRVLRGHWFARRSGLDWLPLREDLSEQLEIAYENRIWRRRRFQPSGLYAARFNLHGDTQGIHALFTGEDDSWEAWLCFETTGISMVLGFRGGAIRLRRGFAMPESATPTQDEIRQNREEQMDDYASKVPVRHVVFMVHGIGQRLEKASLIDDVSSFRQTVAMLADEHLTKYQIESQRILFIPCQWRRGLKLGGESIVEDITLEGVRALRTMLSATVHDVLYYMSPVYCQDIIDSVSANLNRLYGKFLKRNPNYDGKVSIYGHSLGCVLSYDILCHQTAESAVSTVPIAEVRPGLLEKSRGKEPSSDAGYDGNEAFKSQDSNASNSASQNSTKSEEDSDAAAATSESQGGIKCEQKKAEQQTDGDALDGNSQLEALKAEVNHLRMELSLLKEHSKEEPDAASRAQDSQDEASDGLTSEISQKEPKSGLSSNKDKMASPDSRDGAKMGEGDRSTSKKTFTPYISYTKLNFKVDTFYAVGSPLGVFLSLRNIRIGEGMGQEYWQDDTAEEEMPAVRQMMNIFHPYDPVAYRLEPLICKELVKERPVFVPYHKGGQRFHIGIQEFQEDLSARFRAVKKSWRSLGKKIFNSLTPESLHAEPEEDDVRRENTYGEDMLEKLTGPGGRLDYQLQDSTFEHQYIAVLSSHTAYWHDFDTALFILRHLYRDIPPEPPPPQDESISGDESRDSEEGRRAREVANSFRLLQPDLDEMSLTFLPKDALTAVLDKANRVNPDWMI